jgi:hypothetical protein
LQCGSCSSAQVDTYFCPSCLNSVFTTPAFANQNRCEQCVECPVCQHTLVSSSNHASRSTTGTTGGLYAYHCEYCKWSSVEDYEPQLRNITRSDAASSSEASASNNNNNNSNTYAPLTSAEANLLSARVKEAESNPGQAATFAYLVAHHKARHRMAQAAAAAQAGLALSSGPSSSSSALGFSTNSRGNSGRARLFDEFETLLAASDAANPLVADGSAPGNGYSRAASRVASMSSAGGSPFSDGTGPPPSLDALSLESSNVARWMSWRSSREALLHAQHYTLPSEAVTNPFDPVDPLLLGVFDGGDDGGQSSSGGGVEDVASLQQRLAHPSTQLVRSRGLPPRRKALATKVAHRCNHCHKHLVKPGPGAAKPTFEILLAALSFIPTVTIAQFQPLRVGVATDITSVKAQNEALACAQCTSSTIARPWRPTC